MAGLVAANHMANAAPSNGTSIGPLLRKAFDATMNDPAFIADMKQRKRMYDPKTGAKLVKLMAEVLATPKALVNQVRGYLGYL